MFYFKDIEFLYLLLLLIPFVYLLRNHVDTLERVFSKRVLEKIKIKNRALSKRARNILMLLSMVFLIIALARAQIDKGEIKVKSSFINVVTALDMSRSMFANDIYPNRFEFAKMKFLDSLEYFKNIKVALIGFSSKTFLISPLTEDFHSLKFLTKNLNLDYLSLKGTNILSALESANDLLGDESDKVLLIFSDGGDQKEFSKEIEYAKKHKITVYVYNIGTDKGGVIKTQNGVLKDKNGDIVILKRDDSIKELAIQSGGAYLKYSLAKNDIKVLIDDIRAKHKAKKEQNTTIKDTKELFYYPLIVAIILFFMSLFSLPQKVA